jgi:sodium/proline symporter
VVGWKQLSGGIFDLYELVPGFVLAWLAAWAVSRIGSAPGGESNAAFDRALGHLHKDAGGLVSD